ncbi:hypothetical protein P3G55_24215 [Leptospira sp. 96542]|nr:hypothetical protein [Leptospira sp. 96542]
MNSIDEDNGILAKVGGQYIAQAMQTLPIAPTSKVAEAVAEIDAGWVGRVRIRYRIHKYRHHKTSMSTWVAVHAELVK